MNFSLRACVFRTRKLALPCLLPLALSPGASHAQGESERLHAEAFVGSEAEEYLRLLQLGGQTPLYPWSIRAFSPVETDRLLPPDSVRHPWSGRYASASGSAAGLQLDWIRPKAQLIYNSTFPYGSNDGPVWAGRGVTSVLQAGVAARYGPFSLTLAPLVFRAENAGFPLAPNGQTGELVYADPLLPRNIDRPQRFGDGSYVRIDPGQSTLRADVSVFAAGISTANQHWGPAADHPLLLGGNAPGYLHAFAGTSRPMDVWLGRVHGRLVWGRLEESGYSSLDPDSSARFMSGMVGVFTPRGAPGLELGFGRFFHTPWPDTGLPPLGFYAKPIESLFKATLNRKHGANGNSADNQLASFFARWVFPKSGLEMYGEYAREDHSWDLRDFLLEPDQHSAYTVGIRKLWSRDGASRFTVLRGEVMNAQVSHLVLVRPQAPFYKHSALGHTHRGQVLGSPAAYGGAGSVLAVDRYHPGGRWTVSWTRAVSDPGVRHGPEELDMTHAVGVESLFFRGRWEVAVGLEGAYQFNRNYEADAANLNVQIGFRAGL